MQSTAIGKRFEGATQAPDGPDVDGRCAYIALGANLSGPLGPPRATLEAAVAVLAAHPALTVTAQSRWVASPAFPPSDQPDFVNGVVAAHSALAPEDLLALLHAVEARFGRVRGLPNAARTLDLDLLDCGGLVRSEAPILPHPRLIHRGFVLRPLAEIAPGWHHPVSGESVAALCAALPPDQTVTPLPD